MRELDGEITEAEIVAMTDDHILITECVISSGDHNSFQK